MISKYSRANEFFVSDPRLESLGRRSGEVVPDFSQFGLEDYPMQ